jgi:outer membrane usher protein
LIGQGEKYVYFNKKRDDVFSSVSRTFFVLVPALALGFSNNTLARDFFDPDFIKSVGQNDPSSIPDLSLYATKDAQAPGKYRIDVVLNNNLQETTDVRFVEKKILLPVI